ncbi:MAG: penicillin acylase family protein, partial [Deltaproteobacteria bacterium]|nr:penicillin acylase family protein [Deltaproteobacteria bacterium]
MLRQLFRLTLGARAPQVDGEVQVPGLEGAVSIRRDRHGVPYIRASTDADAFFALGFCQAQDRAFQLELLVRIARGTAAEVFGEELLDADRLARRIGFARIAAAQLALADARTRAEFDAFARGVNAGHHAGGAGRPQELVLLGAEPTQFLPSDPLAVLAFMSFAVSTNWDAELARLRVLQEDGLEALLRSEAAPDRIRQDAELLDRLARDAELLRTAPALSAGLRAASAVGLPLGASNHWAISGSRTRTGRPLLAADPHLGPSLPAPWYLAQIRTPEMVMSGACFVSQPVMSIGHNDHVAWAVTIGHADNTDLFVERLAPDGTKVLSGEDYVPCEVREERIAVRGRTAVIERVTVTPRGPIVSPVMGPPGAVLALRGTWMAARAPGGYQIFRARDVDEAGAAFDSYPTLTENRVFADVDGAIAWQMNGDLPRRRRASGLLPAPGSVAEAWWEDEPRARAELPHERNPARGWVASANQRPAALDAPGAPFLGADFLDSYR